ncbi:GNAT family N-acetyltransferase [Micromonospora yangpuensis]|uniref:Predicted N-acyltransferase n=1 Tax=Micromonospora yangpuensis TaxID=683228 RepID=A0A1C6U9V2_9ACTN|nr:GNAT family N-acetyltransferase [Micromonospora yangpuensis]GGL87879.1 hypothetical protein GCM10012279_01950 [Micromonospora yangpuensis]SCL50875.1 Predicted N-acyltransferase [Micromonospora yangpuensis]
MPADPYPRLTEVSTIADLPPQEWAALSAGASLYQTHGWLHWAEEYFDLPTRYVLAYDADGTLVGAVVTNLMTEVPTRFTTWYDPVNMFLAPHVDPAGAAERWFPVLLVGGCSGYHGELLLDARLDADAQAEVRRAILDRCRELAARWGARSTVFMYLPKEAAEEVCRSWGGTAPVVATSAEAVIPLDGGETDFADYLARFPSARRSKLRKEVDGFTAAGSRIGQHLLADVLTEVAPLLGAHQRKFGATITDEETGQYFALQDKYLGAGSVVFTDERDGRINGFTLCYAHGDTLYSRAAGFGPDAAPFAYFNLAVYAPIRHALATGRRAVALGAGSYQGKVLRGAQVHGLWSTVLPPHPLEPSWHDALTRPFPQAVEAGICKEGPPVNAF